MLAYLDFGGFIVRSFFSLFVPRLCTVDQHCCYTLWRCADSGVEKGYLQNISGLLRKMMIMMKPDTQTDRAASAGGQDYLFYAVNLNDKHCLNRFNIQIMLLCNANNFHL